MALPKPLKSATVWQYWAHIAVIIILLIIAVPYFDANPFPFVLSADWLGKFLKFFVLLGVIDTAVHFIFSVLPGKYKWVD